MSEQSLASGTELADIDIVGIMRMIPHRYPFLLIDRVVELEAFKRAVGIKNVTINEPFFQGHFPGHPIMPGVLIIEAMAQVTRNGAIVMPPVPAFYHRPSSVDDIVTQTVGRALDLFGIDVGVKRCKDDGAAPS